MSTNNAPSLPDAEKAESVVAYYRGVYAGARAALSRAQEVEEAAHQSLMNAEIILAKLESQGKAMNTKHTPGPYHRVPNGRGYFICADSENGRVEVATVHAEAEYGELPSDANARLIAAAPDGFEALRMAYDYMTDTLGWDDSDYMVRRMKDALTKAGLL